MKHEPWFGVCHNKKISDMLMSIEEDFEGQFE
jgi:hypothetical protein